MHADWLNDLRKGSEQKGSNMLLDRKEDEEDTKDMIFSQSR